MAGNFLGLWFKPFTVWYENSFGLLMMQFTLLEKNILITF